MTRCAWITAVIFFSACAGDPALTEIQRVRAGGLDLVLLADDGVLNDGRDTFTVEFRTASGELADVTDVQATATMPMAGMAPMFGDVTLARNETGRYTATSNLGMAGDWQIRIEWRGAEGPASAMLSTSAQ